MEVSARFTYIRTQGHFLPQPLSLGFLESLVRSLAGSSTAEILPEKVLTKGDRMIVWWTAACRRQMFYENSDQKAAGLNGRTFPQPALGWRVDNGDVMIRALADNRQPAAAMTMAVAPFWNR